MEAPAIAHGHLTQSCRGKGPSPGGPRAELATTGFCISPGFRRQLVKREASPQRLRVNVAPWNFVCLRGGRTTVTNCGQPQLVTLSCTPTCYFFPRWKWPRKVVLRRAKRHHGLMKIRDVDSTAAPKLICFHARYTVAPGRFHRR